MKKNKIFIGIGIFTFVLYAIFYSFQGDELLEKSGQYTIGIITEIEGGGGRGCSLKIYVSFNFKGTEQKEVICEGLEKIDNSFVGKRCFLKIIPKQLDRKINIYYSCSVPDSIQSAPSEGWSQEWMQDHFPDCAK